MENANVERGTLMVMHTNKAKVIAALASGRQNLPPTIGKAPLLDCQAKDRITTRQISPTEFSAGEQP
jgi:hypothetical protein